jgi:CheY-like chemotaxis protein
VWLIFSDRKISHQQIYVAPTDLRCLQSNLAIAARCPAEICGLSNHNKESVRTRNHLKPAIGNRRRPDVGAMRAGAVDFLTEPVRSADLQNAIRFAGKPMRAVRSHSIANALDTMATGLLSEALDKVTRPKLMVRPRRTTRASASTSDEVAARMKCVV